jgi:hypothetical protein
MATSGERADIARAISRWVLASSIGSFALEASHLEVDVDEEGDQRAHHGRLADRRVAIVRSLGGPLERISRERSVAPGKVEVGERADGVGVLFESIQQLGGFLDAALSDTQVREADGGLAPRRQTPVEVVGGTSPGSGGPAIGGI